MASYLREYGKLRLFVKLGINVYKVIVPTVCTVILNSSFVLTLLVYQQQQLDIGVSTVFQEIQEFLKYILHKATPNSYFSFLCYVASSLKCM